MNSAATTKTPHLATTIARSDRWAKSLVTSLLKRLQRGQITLHDGDETQIFGHESSLGVHVWVHHPNVYKKVLFGGSVGAGEAYVEALWDVDNLTQLVRIMVLNMGLLDSMERGFAWLLFPLRLFSHLRNSNSRKGARRNILSHYDLGNEMYQSFLDPTMMYSSAIYTEKHTTLEEASLNKLDTICKSLDLQETDRVVEIGAGWCGFAIYAAGKYGCHVTTTTISDAQYQEGKRRITKAGLDDKITLLKKDYRDLTGKYDKLVSIEMIEAVGHSYHEQFLKVCQNLLKKNGKMLLQAITITDQRYDQYITGGVST